MKKLNWEYQAQWLRKNGYHLVIEEYGGGSGEFSEYYAKWVAYVNKDNKIYSNSIPDAISAIYYEIKKGIEHG